ncbi:MAG: class I SAM-dependent methyltransferase [Hyphomicrobiales bacterium]|nr:class I SAM-dependent methyltransferase [Hyphomicrobiales bacterium]
MEDTHEQDAAAACPACGGASAPDGEKDGYAVFRCGACDLLFVHPFPTAEELARYYSDNYRGATATFYPKLNSRRRRAFVKSLRFLRYAVGRRVLDIGCGGGVMVDAFRRLGADAHGVDISVNSITFARNRFPRCTFHCMDFDEMARSGLTFDFMFTSELMEHIPGPHGCMAMIQALSKPGTLVYVATPDAGHPAVPADIYAWDQMCPPEHLQWFTRDNLARVFDGYGFDLARAFPKKSPALSLLFRRRG